MADEKNITKAPAPKPTITKSTSTPAASTPTSVEVTSLFPVYYTDANGLVKEWQFAGDTKELSVEEIKADIAVIGVLPIFQERLAFDMKVKESLGI